ncbi:hypothetical protein RUND412_007144 [Rhizina undulata]
MRQDDVLSVKHDSVKDDDEEYSTFTPESSKAAASRGVDTAAALFEDAERSGEQEIDPKEERKLIWSIDFRILPYLLLIDCFFYIDKIEANGVGMRGTSLAVCYCFFYIDKTTLSYAAIFGIEEDLKLHGNQYSWLSSVFYFGFLTWAFPTNFLIQKFPVGKYLGFNVFIWGMFLMLQAACNSFSSLMVMRFLGGAAEACSDPAFMLITSMWYTRREQPIRLGLWYTANGLGIAGGGLLGYAIGHIRGSLPSWKYEFLIIGALCAIWGVVMFLFLPDSPVSAPFLNDKQRRMAIERLKGNQTGIENKTFKLYQVKEAFMDYKLYLFFIIGLVGNVPNGGISNFGTLIIKGFNFSTLVTTLLQVPYGIIISISVLSCVFINDRLPVNSRCYMIVAFLIPNVAGTFGLMFVPLDRHVGRLMCYYLTGPYNAAFVMFLSLQIGNTAGHTKKVVTNAVLFLGYCTGNIIGPFFYKESQRPVYKLGIASMIFCHLLEMVLILLLRFLLSSENKHRDKAQAGQERNLAETAFKDLTDRENVCQFHPISRTRKKANEVVE